MDPGRYSGLLACFGYLLVAALLLNGFFQHAVGRLWSPDKWYQLNRDLLDMVGGKSQIVAEGYTGRPRPLIVALGPSSMRLGLDSDQAKELSGVPWLNLGVLGASIVTLRNNTTPFFESGLRPDIVILGFCSCWLGRDGGFREDADTYDPKGWTWLTRNRRPLADQALRLMLTVRARWGLHRWPSELWDTRQKAFTSAPPSFLQWQLQQVTKRGYFQPANYLRFANDEARALAMLLSDLKALGVKRVIVVDMPVHSAIRGRTPPEAASLVKRLVDTVAVPGLELYDLRGALRDDEFVDYFHANPAGERKLTEALARLVH